MLTALLPNNFYGGRKNVAGKRGYFIIEIHYFMNTNLQLRVKCMLLLPPCDSMQLPKVILPIFPLEHIKGSMVNCRFAQKIKQYDLP